MCGFAPVSRRSWIPDGERACRRDPVHRALSGIRISGHPSVRSTRGLAPRCRTGSPCPLFDLAPSGGCRAAGIAPDAGAPLPHRFTLTCADRGRPSAVCSLLPFPTGHPVLVLTSALPYGVPTFLDGRTRRGRSARSPWGPRPYGTISARSNGSTWWSFRPDSARRRCVPSHSRHTGSWHPRGGASSPTSRRRHLVEQGQRRAVGPEVDAADRAGGDVEAPRHQVAGVEGPRHRRLDG